MPLPFARQEVITHSARMAQSFRHFTGHPLIESADLAHALYHAPFALVSHNAAPDPVFIYANLAAQTLWNLPWEEFVGMPSRLSAEPIAQAERETLLQRALAHGFVPDYRGVRIAQGGRRFEISDTVLWNVRDESGERIGQAARIGEWQWLAG